jgi:dUTP pyrophosphatase
MKEPLMLQIKILKMNEYAIIPQKGSSHAVGFDIHCNFYELAQQDFAKETRSLPFQDYLDKYSVTIKSQSGALLPTGLIFEMPHHIEMDIKSRSGFFSKHGILAQGTIDPDYRGQVKIMLFNLSQKDFTITHKERVAQAVFRSIYNDDNIFLSVKSIQEMTQTERQSGGFGSTGIL